MKLTFEELKTRYPIGKRVGAYQDKVPKSAHTSFESMCSWLSIHVATPYSERIEGEYFVFSEYE
jgi:hypothetical protein